MSDETMPEQGLMRAVAVVTFAGMAVFLSGTWLYARFGGSVVDAFDEELGEVLMERGMRFEEAGSLENAKAVYAEALNCPFQGPQNRADTQKRLGVLYWQAGDLDAAVRCLQPAAEAEPPPVSVFEPLCDCLLSLGRLAEAQEVVFRWMERAGELRLPAEKGKAKYYEGKIALAEGDRQRAETAFLEGLRELPGGRNASELGQMYYEQGRHAEALPQIDAYLLTGTGERAEYFRWLRGHILKLLQEKETGTMP
ncbi:MAG: tetratricopeptide repeat protein [Candidatus Hydrogenedentes bacterium]|nr:tetratricopeptide repeat protein [Candidatus Hydrogenedentota bacterium]